MKRPAAIIIVTPLAACSPFADAIADVSDLWAALMEIELDAEEIQLLEAIREWLVYEGWLPAGPTTPEQEITATGYALEVLNEVRADDGSFPYPGVILNRVEGKIRLDGLAVDRARETVRNRRLRENDGTDSAVTITGDPTQPQPEVWRDEGGGETINYEDERWLQ